MVGDADASVVADAMEPPPVPDSLLRELERKGLRPPRDGARLRSADPPTRSREEQLAILQRQIDEEEAAKSAKSGEGDTATA